MSEGVMRETEGCVMPGGVCEGSLCRQPRTRGIERTGRKS